MSDPGLPPAGGTPPAPPAPPDVATLQQQLADARAEAAARRVEARTAQERVQTVESELGQIRETEPQRLQAATAPLQQTVDRATSRVVDAELRAAAIAEGLVDGDLLPLIDKTGVSYDPATGALTGVTEAVTRFKTAKPAYFQARGSAPPVLPPRQPSGSGREPTPPAGGGTEKPDVRALDKKGYGAAKKDALRELSRH